MNDLLRGYCGALLLPGLVLILLAGTGCGRDRARVQIPQVAPLPTSDAAALDADQTVRLMRQAGFSNSEILELGPYLRNAIALQGGARVRVGDKVEAVFAVDGRRLHVSSRRTGSFIFLLEEPP